MTHTLLIAVRFHVGRYHGTRDWPPSPARLFQALVAAAAKPALADASREALKWLEKLDAPTIAAPAMKLGQHVKLFVPNNDLDAKGGDIRRVAEIRGATKHNQPRLFDASVPLLYVWHYEEGDEQAKHVCAIAEGLYQLGRGVDMAWAVGEVLGKAEVEERLNTYPGVIYHPSVGGEGVTLDCHEEGSLVSLIERYEAGATRFRHDKEGKTTRTEFANAPKPRFCSLAYNSPVSHLLYDLRRTTAPGSPFAPWPLKRAAELVQIIRGRTATEGKPVSGAAKRLWDALPNKQGEIERVFIGRKTKDVDKAMRLRIVPLPSVGHVHARGIRRVLVEVPANCPLSTRDIAWAFSGLEVMPMKVDTETGEILASSVELVPAADRSMLRHYGHNDDLVSRVWRSVTPLALRAKSAHEVVQALRHVGIRQHITGLRMQREPFEANGESAELFAVGTRYSEHQLWHVELEFAEPVGGSIVLGNGRYAGLGLMVPMRQVEGVFSYSIVDGLEAQANAPELARALRRAVMARVQTVLAKRGTLPLFFTGHEDDGAPTSRGSHAHLAFVPDLERQRLFVIAPHVLEHREATREEKKHLLALQQALAGFDELRAGRNGKMRLEATSIYVDTDPLFTVSAEWKMATPYTATRHAKRNGRDSIMEDVVRELLRRQLPRPLAVEVGTRNSMNLQFSIAVPGPILLGKDLHFGGGLFIAGS